MTDKTVHYATAAVAASDGVRFDTQARLRAIAESADINSGAIGLPEFDKQMNRLENDRAAVEQEKRNAKAVAKWAGSADSAPSYSRPPGLKTMGGTPQPVADDVQCRAMFDKAMSGESCVIRTKDTLPFNDTAESQLPAQLAPWITQQIHERRLMDRLPTTACTAPSSEIVRHVSTTGAASMVAEGTPKPTVQLNLEHITLPMLKLAANTAVSWEVISDYDRFLDYVQIELPRQIVDVENTQILYGAGSLYGQLQGFANTPSILLNDATPAASSASATAFLDVIEESIEQLRSGPALAERNLCVTSPSTFSALRRIKDDLHRYILAPDPTQDEAMNLWGMPVLVTTQAIPGDMFLLDTTKFGKVIVREGITIRQGTADDDFVRNLLRWIYEERLNLGVERPSAIRYLTSLPTTSYGS
jgi:HK97 family phage major capsid protein